MLTLVVTGEEQYNEVLQEFITVGAGVLELEHSLVSLSKWESKWEIPFLGPKEKTTEQTLDYIKMMCVNEEEVDPEIFKYLNSSDYAKINEYITSKQTATWFTELGGNTPATQELMTAEVLYYYLVTFQIPFECQYWHLNRLLTLIRVINEKNKPPRKMSKAALAERNRALNERRLRELGTRG